MSERARPWTYLQKGVFIDLFLSEPICLSTEIMEEEGKVSMELVSDLLLREWRLQECTLNAVGSGPLGTSTARHLRPTRILPVTSRSPIS